MDLVKCPCCGEEYSPSYHKCPFCEEDDDPRRVKSKMRRGHRVTEKKKSYSGRNALIIILLFVLALLTWVLFGDRLVERFAKPETPPTEDVTPPDDSVTDDPFYDPNAGESVDGADPNAATQPTLTDPENMDAANAVLSSEDFTISTGESAQLSVTGSDAPVTWTSADPTVAVVGSGGLVTAVNAGMTTVAAQVGERTLSCVVRVKDAAAPEGTGGNASGAALSKTDFTAKVGESVKLKVAGTNASVSWSVDNSGIATVSPDGVVKGVKAGRTTVYAKVGGQTLECIVRIK